MTALIVIGIIVLVFFLIGQIRTGVYFSMIDDKISVAVRVYGFTIQLLPRKKKKEKNEEQDKPQEPEPEKEEKKEKKRKPRKPRKKRFFKIDRYDVNEILAIVKKGYKILKRGLRCDMLLFHFTAASWDPYVTARLYTYVNAFLSGVYPILEDKRKYRNTDIRTEVDFNKPWPELDLAYYVTFRIGASFEMLFYVLFRVIWVFLKIIFRFLWMKIFDPEEYDFRMNQQENIFAFFLRVIRVSKARKAKSMRDKENAESAETGGNSASAAAGSTLLIGTDGGLKTDSRSDAAQEQTETENNQELLKIAAEYAAQNGCVLDSSQNPDQDQNLSDKSDVQSNSSDAVQ